MYMFTIEIFVIFTDKYYLYPCSGRTNISFFIPIQLPSYYVGKSCSVKSVNLILIFAKNNKYNRLYKLKKQIFDGPGHIDTLNIFAKKITLDTLSPKTESAGMAYLLVALLYLRKLGHIWKPALAINPRAF